MQFKKKLVYIVLSCVLMLSGAVILINIQAQAPEQAQIAFYSKRDGNLEVYVMDADGRNPRNLTNNSEDDREPASQGAASFPVETTEQHAARYEAVAKRRAGTVVLVHRGAWFFAPENSLEALAAAIDYGADGCEVDLSRTADGVIVLFHDSMLDRLTYAIGRVGELTYAELQSLPLRDYHGRRTTVRVPTFVDLLILARQRAMLLFLDFKSPDMEDEVHQLLNAMDMWDHVMSIGGVETTARLRERPEFKRLHFKEGLYIGRRDMDPEEIRSALDKRGQMIVVEDPRPAAMVLGREAYRPMGLPEGIRAHRGPLTTAPAPSPDAIITWRYMQNLGQEIDASDESALIELLAKDARDQMPPDDEVALRAYSQRILKRAWAAQRLGERGVKSEEGLSAPF